MEKPSTNKLPRRSISLGKDATEDFLNFENENHSKEELALDQVRELKCSNEGH